MSDAGTSGEVEGTVLTDKQEVMYCEHSLVRSHAERLRVGHFDFSSLKFPLSLSQVSVPFSSCLLRFTGKCVWNTKFQKTTLCDVTNHMDGFPMTCQVLLVSAPIQKGPKTHQYSLF